MIIKVFGDENENNLPNKWYIVQSDVINLVDFSSIKNEIIFYNY
jgi:hypothetical protein